jgi:hypothetical protein
MGSLGSKKGSHDLKLTENENRREREMEKLPEHSGSGSEQRVSKGEPRMNRDERKVLSG